MPQRAESWVVYLMTIYNKPEGRNAVCTQDEWNAMELHRPGYHHLIRDGFASEAEAELMARGTSGDPVQRAGKLR
jgi:hypothetical protein